MHNEQRDVEIVKIHPQAPDIDTLFGVAFESSLLVNAPPLFLLLA